MIERRGDRVDVLWSHDNSLHAIAHKVARLARSDLPQRAGGRFISDFGAALPLRRKNVNRALDQTILWIAHKSYKPNIISPEYLEILLRFITHRTHKPSHGER